MIEKKKRAIPWKSGKVISIRLRNGVYVLAQMVREPYLVFFNHFKEENSWKGVTLKEENILFCKAVTRQFLRSSPVTIVKDLEPLLDYRLPKGGQSSDGTFPSLYPTRYPRARLGAGRSG